MTSTKDTDRLVDDKPSDPVVVLRDPGHDVSGVVDKEDPAKATDASEKNCDSEDTDASEKKEKRLQKRKMDQDERKRKRYHRCNDVAAYALGGATIVASFFAPETAAAAIVPLMVGSHLLNRAKTRTLEEKVDGTEDRLDRLEVVVIEKQQTIIEKLDKMVSQLTTANQSSTSTERQEAA